MKQDTTTFISTFISTLNSFEHSIKTKKCLSPPQQPASATSYVMSAMCHVHTLKLPARHSWRSCLFSLVLLLLFPFFLSFFLPLFPLGHFFLSLSSFFALLLLIFLFVCLSQVLTPTRPITFFSPLPLISLLH